MNIEAYNLDSLRKLVRALQAENKELRELLEKAEIPYSNSEVFVDTPVRKVEFDLDQGGRITQQFIDKKLAVRFFSMFWGREDVFAKRAKNGNYYPQCDNRWNNALCPKHKGEKTYCGDCEHACWTELTPEILMSHLLGYRDDGTDVIGVYPLLADGTCRFLVFDFDNHEKDAAETDFANEDELWHDEVDALRLICKQNGIDALVERSRSGKGAHVWIFFQKPISASLARNFGFLLLDKGATTINLKSFKYYDRMYPSQDVTDSIGNLIALPLQGVALKNGNSAFVDENWNAYPQQWEQVNRDYEGKKDVIVYDYIDSHISKFENMYLKRLRAYKKIGFKVVSNTVENKQDVNAIYDSGNYMEVFERDLIEAEKEIVISSPHIIREKILRFISIVKARQESGVKITVITESPERTMFGNTAFLYALIRQMKDVGIRVEISEEEIEHFAVIDHSLVWHGGMNLLGKEDAWDNLIRVRDEKAAAELLDMAFEG